MFVVLLCRAIRVCPSRSSRVHYGIERFLVNTVGINRRFDVNTCVLVDSGPALNPPCSVCCLEKNLNFELLKKLKFNVEKKIINSSFKFEKLFSWILIKIRLETLPPTPAPLQPHRGHRQPGGPSQGKLRGEPS